MKFSLLPLLTATLLLAAGSTARAQSISSIDNRKVTTLQLRDSTKTVPLQNVPGVTIHQTPTPQRRDSVKVRLGGCYHDNSTQPLFIIDGRVVDSDKMRTDLNPADIETLEVLKGPAATALFGSQAQCGVILITTKRKPRFKPAAPRPVDGVPAHR